MKGISQKELEARIQSWKDRYLARLLERGLDRSLAQNCANGAEVDFDIEPEEAADDEVSYIAEGA